MTIAIVQARLGSSRLHRKALLDLCGRPMITHVLERVLQVPELSAVVLAVPASDVSAMPTGRWLVRGYPEIADGDVLGRFVRVIDEFPQCDTVMRVTGDCPLLNPAMSWAVLRRYQESAKIPFLRQKAYYASNVSWPDYIDGEDTEVFSAGILRMAQQWAVGPQDREHVTPWIRRYCHAPAPVTPLAKTSVDTREDYERVKRMLECPSIKSCTTEPRSFQVEA